MSYFKVNLHFFVFFEQSTNVLLLYYTRANVGNFVTKSKVHVNNSALGTCLVFSLLKATSTND